MASEMIWAIRRQLSAVVLYCSPRSCWPANTSHNRNSALRRPSDCVMRPVASAWALICRQAGERGSVSMVEIFSIEAAGAMGAQKAARHKVGASTWRKVGHAPGRDRQTRDQL